jgi:hypothetical protein
VFIVKYLTGGTDVTPERVDVLVVDRFASGADVFFQLGDGVFLSDVVARVVDEFVETAAKVCRVAVLF